MINLWGLGMYVMVAGDLGKSLTGNFRASEDAPSIRETEPDWLVVCQNEYQVQRLSALEHALSGPAYYSQSGRASA